MGKYICEVKRDDDQNEIELVHSTKYDLSSSSPEQGAIKFKTADELQRYFINHCISEDTLLQEAKQGSNLFTFLFWILLLIFIITIVFQMYNSGEKLKIPTTAFGRFSF